MERAGTKRNNKLEFEGELVTLRCKKTPEARNVREGSKRQKLHRAPQGWAPRQGAGCPREWAFEGGNGSPEGP